MEVFISVFVHAHANTFVVFDLVEMTIIMKYKLR